MIYVFGGVSSSAVDTWQYADALLLLNVTQPLNNDSISYSTSLSASCYYPTKSPSIYPTQVPLECIDYNTQSISNDGKDIISNTTFLLEIDELFSNISEINTTIEYYKNIQFEETKHCYGNVSVCYIDCTESRSCALSSVEIDHMNMEHLIIRCQDTASCYSLTVRFINASIKTVNILCSDSKSCSLMKINAWNVSVGSFHIHCNGERACLNMKLQITATNEYHEINNIVFVCSELSSCGNIEYDTIDVQIRHTIFMCRETYSCNMTSIHSKSYGNGSMSIFCMNDRSCNQFAITITNYTMAMDDYDYMVLNMECVNDYSCQQVAVNISDEIYFNLNVYKYSPDIVITNGDIFNMNIECRNNEDQLFIRYDTYNLKTNQQLLDLTREKYNSNHLPCEGVRIDCSMNGSVSKSCEYEYNVKALNMTKILLRQSEDDEACYWLDILDLIKPVCIGECHNNITLYAYNPLLYFDVVIDTTNQSDAKLAEICDSFFASVNKTFKTLSDINSIFENILKSVYNSYEVYHIVDGPNTILFGNKQKLNCTNLREFDVIHLQIEMDILSGIEGYENVQQLWERLQFRQHVEDLLSLYFRIPVDINQNIFPLYPHNITLNFDIIIDTSNHSYDELVATCDLFFGSTNMTTITLLDIDDIFLKIFKMIYSILEIYDIFVGPDTILSNGRLELNCSNLTDFEIIHLQMNMNIWSGIENRKDIYELWEREELTDTVNDWLSLYFGITVIVVVQKLVLPSAKGFWRAIYVDGIIAGSLFIIILILFIIYYKKQRRNRKLELLSTYIKNPLVIAVAIGKYNKSGKNKDVELKDMDFQELTAIDNDIKNIQRLFEHTMNYQMRPEYQLNHKIKTHWTEEEVLELMKKEAKYLDKAVRNGKHDGLIVIISAHGIRDNIISSDYKKINKDTIHRIYSVNHPALRDIPRIMIYDCCDGLNDKNREHHRYSVMPDVEKQISKGSTKSNENDDEVNGHRRVMTDIYGEDKAMWFKDESNPDYNLVVINSSNKGFVSQMGSKSGSYMIRKFTEYMLDNINGKNKLFLFQIFHAIQEELHNKSLQLVEAKYNNKLEYIKFVKNNGMDEICVENTDTILEKSPKLYLSVDSDEEQSDIHVENELEMMEKN